MFKRNNLRPQPRALHGIEVKKQPTLAYLEAVERTSGLLMECLDEIFPGKQPGQVLDDLINMDAEGFKALASRALAVIPRKALTILREIVGAKDNPAWESLTPYEHSEVIKAFWELNDLSAFFQNARGIIAAQAQKRQSTDLNG